MPLCADIVLQFEMPLKLRYKYYYDGTRQSSPKGQESEFQY